MDKLEVARLRLAGSRIFVAHTAAYKREFVFRVEEESSSFVLQAQSKEEFDNWLSLFRYHGVDVLPLLKEGYLHKKGKGRVAVSSRRYFVLYPDNLMWLKDEFQPRQIDMVPIRDTTSVAVTSNLGKFPGFSVETPKVGRKYMLGADTAEDRDRWVSILEDTKTSYRPTKEGSLSFTPPTSKGAKRLRAVLMGSVLRFYDDKDNELKQEAVALRGNSKVSVCSSVAPNEGGSLSCSFDLWHLGITVRYWATTELQRKDWMDKLAVAIVNQERAFLELETRLRKVLSKSVEGNFLLHDDVRGFLPVQLSLEPDGEVKVMRSSGDIKTSRPPDEVKQAGSLGIHAREQSGEQSQSSPEKQRLREEAKASGRRSTLSDSKFILSGYLNKLSSSRVSQKRFFALNHTNLCYWAAERDALCMAPKGSIPLITVSEVTLGKNRLEISLRDFFGLSATRVLTLLFASPEAANQWQLVLNDVIQKKREQVLKSGQAPAWLNEPSPQTALPDPASPQPAAVSASAPSTSSASTSSSPNTPMHTATTATANMSTNTATGATSTTTSIPLTAAPPLSSARPGRTPDSSTEETMPPRTDSLSDLDKDKGSTSSSTSGSSSARSSLTLMSPKPLLAAMSTTPPSSPRPPPLIKETFDILLPVLSNLKIETSNEAQNAVRYHSYSISLNQLSLKKNKPEKKQAPPPPPLAKSKSVLTHHAVDEKPRAGEIFLDEILLGKRGEYKTPEVITLFIFQTVARGDIPTTAYLAQELNDDLDFSDSGGNTLLHTAAAKGKVEMVKLLVEHFEMDLNELNNEKLTPLQVAEIAKQSAVILYLRHAFMVSSLAAQALFKEDFVNIFLGKVVNKSKTTSGFVVPDGSGTRPMSFSVLLELITSPRSVAHKSMALSQLTIHLSCPKLPLRQKLFGESKPNPMVCILTQAGDGHPGFMAFSTEVARKTCSPVFGHVAVFYPVLTPACEQSLLVGVFDEGPDTMHLIGFARVYARDLIGPPSNNTKTLNVSLSKPAAKDDGFQKSKEPWTIALDCKAVYYTLAEQIENAMMTYHTPCRSWDLARRFAACEDNSCLDRNKVLELLEVNTVASVIQETIKQFYLLLRLGDKVFVPANGKESDSTDEEQDDLGPSVLPSAPGPTENPRLDPPQTDSDTDTDLYDTIEHPGLWDDEDEMVIGKNTTFDITSPSSSLILSNPLLPSSPTVRPVTPAFTSTTPILSPTTTSTIAPTATTTVPLPKLSTASSILGKEHTKEPSAPIRSSSEEKLAGVHRTTNSETKTTSVTRPSVAQSQRVGFVEPGLIRHDTSSFRTPSSRAFPPTPPPASSSSSSPSSSSSSSSATASCFSGPLSAPSCSSYSSPSTSTAPSTVTATSRATPSTTTPHTTSATSVTTTATTSLDPASSTPQASTSPTTSFSILSQSYIAPSLPPPSTSSPTYEGPTRSRSASSRPSSPSSSASSSSGFSPRFDSFFSPLPSPSVVSSSSSLSPASSASSTSSASSSRSASSKRSPRTSPTHALSSPATEWSDPLSVKPRSISTLDSTMADPLSVKSTRRPEPSALNSRDFPPPPPPPPPPPSSPLPSKEGKVGDAKIDDSGPSQRGKDVANKLHSDIMRHTGQNLDVLSRLGTLQMESSYMKNKADRLVQFISSAKPGIMIRVFQNVCNTVANYRSFCRDTNREIQTRMASLRAQHRKLAGFIKECETLRFNSQQIGVRHATAHDEWSSGFPEDLGMAIQDLPFADRLCKLHFDKAGTKALHQLVRSQFLGLLRMCPPHGRHRSGVPVPVRPVSSAWLDQSVLPDAATVASAGPLDSEADTNAAFRKRLTETLVLVGWLKREIEAAFDTSFQAISTYLQTSLQALEKELADWEVEMKFFKQFHSELYEHVSQVGTQAYQTTMRRVKEVKLAIYKLSAEALEQALHDTEDKTSDETLEDLEFGTLSHTVEKKPLSKKDETVAKLKQEYKILKDEQEYLYNTFIFQDQQINTKDGTSGLDTVWYIPLSDLLLTGKIGSGEYGDIFRGTNKGIDVAVKVVKDASASPSFTKEFNLWAELKFPYIIQLLGYTKVDGHLAMVMPFCEISLEGFLSSVPPIKEGEWEKNVKHSSWKLRLKIAVQIASGMAYLHEHQGGVLHRDLKAANVLLQGDGQDARICDFGFSKKTSWARSMSGRGKGSPITMAPEVYTSGKSTKAADVYSFGIVLWEIIYCQTPYSHLESDLAEVQFMEMINSGIRPKVLSEDLLPSIVKPYQDMFQDCWQHKAEKRPTFVQLVEALTALSKAELDEF